ncbi:MAG: site-specific integrase [Bacteroidota bacterium]
MRKTCNQNFIIRKSSRKDNPTALVFLRITIDGARTEISLQRECDPERWDSARGRLIGKTEDARSFNAYLDAVQAKIYEIFQIFISSGIGFDGNKVKARFLGLDIEKQRALLVIYEDHNREFELLVGRGQSYRTLQKYKTVQTYLGKFLKYQYALNDIELNRIDYQFIRDFEIYLKTVKKCAHNTTMHYLTKLRKILNLCVVKKWITNSPFKGFKMSVHETHKTILTEQELLVIGEKKITIPRLEQVRDIFLFSCYTGLAYCDVEKLTKANVVVGIDSDKWISTNRSKTNTVSRIPLLPRAAFVVDKYTNHPITSHTGRLLPVMSNQRMNSYLKELADLCGIPKDLTFHCARHTFATTVTLTNGVPIETVSKMLGHKSLKTTQHYAKIVDKKVSEDMKALKQKFSVPVLGS